MLPPVEIDARRLLELAERRLCEREKGLVVLAQRLGRERRKGLAHARFGLGQERQLLGRRAAFGGDLAFEPRAELLGDGELRTQAVPVGQSTLELGLKGGVPERQRRRFRARDGEVRLEPGHANRARPVGAGLEHEPCGRERESKKKYGEERDVHQCEV